MKSRESKYFATARKMNMALIQILSKKEFELVTVKEICKVADVNRSTFYLHYENIGELLDETVENELNDLFQRYKTNQSFTQEAINTLPIDQLIFINKEYLYAYLEFMKEKKNHLYAFIKRSKTLSSKKIMNALFKELIDPIMNRFKIDETQRKYMFIYYVNGIIAIITEWISNGCKEEIDQVIDIIVNCVRPEKKIQ